MGNVWQITTQVSLHPAYRRGVFCIPRKGVHIYPRRNDVVNAHDIRYFRPSSSLFFRPVLRFSRSRPSLSLSLIRHRSRSNGWNLIDLRAPRASSSSRGQRAFSFLPGWNGFYGDGTVTVSWDPRVSYEIWQRDNRVIIWIKAMRDWGWFRERSVALVSIRFLFITFSRLFNFNF